MGRISLKQDVTTSSIFTFVEEFGLHKEFEELEGTPIDEYNHNRTDDEIIKNLLELHVEGEWLVDYIDDNNFGYFRLRSFEVD